MLAVWLLATVWASEVYPERRRRQYLDFGQVIVELFVEDIASLGRHTSAQEGAVEKVDAIRQHPDFSIIKTEDQTRLIVDATATCVL